MNIGSETLYITLILKIDIFLIQLINYILLIRLMFYVGLLCCVHTLFKKYDRVLRYKKNK